MTVTDSRVFGNAAFGDDADQGGGGLFNNGGTLRVTDTRIDGNVAAGASGSGGGVLSTGGTVRIADSFLTDNDAARAGGAIEIIEGRLDLTGSRLTGNTTGDAPGNGGAVHVTGAATTRVVDGFFAGNAAGSEGGALWNSATGTMSVAGSTVRGNIASGDDATNGGGGLFNNGGTLRVFDSTVEDNAADGASGSGGGLFSVGGALVLRDSTVEDNEANRAGGAIEIIGGRLASTDNAYVGNSAGDAPGNGGAIHSSGMGVRVTSTSDLFAQNDAANQGGGLWVGDDVRASVTDSAFLGNSADGEGGGGALYVKSAGDLDVNGALIAGNTAPRGEAISVEPGVARGNVTVSGDTQFGDQTVVLGDVGDRVTGDGFGNTIDGRGGNDTIRGGAGDDVLLGGAGADILSGQSGNDRVIGGQGNDLVGGGIGNDSVFGGMGNDRLFGGDNDDVVFGSSGRDLLTGGDGRDLFVFNAGDTAVRAPDLITDFDAGDRIGLATIDANENAAGDQAFTFIGAQAFSGAAGELRAVTANGFTRVDADTDGNGFSDFRVVLGNGAQVTADDFVL